MVFQSLSHIRLFATPWTAAHQASLSLTQTEFAQASIQSVMPSNHLLSCPHLFNESALLLGGQNIGASASRVCSSIHSVSDAIQPSPPLLPPSHPTLSLSQHRGLFQWVGSSIRWSKYWRFSFNISPFSEYSGLISLSIDWFDLLAVQGTLKSLLQHHNSKASFL